jgi:hypothetical protein
VCRIACVVHVLYVLGGFLVCDVVFRVCCA